jgi:hypothetical protein
MENNNSQTEDLEQKSQITPIDLGDQPKGTPQNVIEVVEVFEIIEVCEFKEHHPHHPNCHHHKHVIEITIDGKAFQVHAGKIAVSKIKQLGGIPLAFELDQLVNGKLIPLPDDGIVKIKECEQFVGIPKDGSSS